VADPPCLLPSDVARRMAAGWGHDREREWGFDSGAGRLAEGAEGAEGARPRSVVGDGWQHGGLPQPHVMIPTHDINLMNWVIINDISCPCKEFTKHNT
jgi:hypothetical protein